MAATERELRELLTTSCRILYRLGLSDYLGHPSVRLPGGDRVLIKPKHSPTVRRLDDMTPDRMVAIDLDGNLVSGEERPPSERFIHTEIYRARPDVVSVVHTHQPMSTLCGIVGLPILPLLHVQAALVERPVPTYPHAMLITDRELGRGVAEALGDHPVCHLQGHGIVAVGRSIQEATLGAIHLERLAEVNVQAAQLGRPPRAIPPEEIARLRTQLAAPEGRWAYYAELAG
jgi:L-ribulose-5-phosphate 4-epimerase